MQSPLTQMDAGPDPNWVPFDKINGKPVKPCKYPACREFYNAYYECVLDKEANFGKFVGRCDEVRRQFDACNERERAVARAKNLEESKQKKAYLEARMAELEKMTEAKKAEVAEPKKKGWFW